MIKLKELRGKKSQREVAEDLDVTQRTYSSYERCDREANYETMIKLANYFNVSLDYLLGRDDTLQSFNEQPSENLNETEQLEQSNNENRLTNQMSCDENKILSLYRLCNDCEKANVTGFINGLLVRK